MEHQRTERDLLGEIKLPADSLYGIQTLRALENFPLACRREREKNQKFIKP